MILILQIFSPLYSTTHIGLVQFLLPKLDTEERREFVILWELLFYAWLLQNTASEKKYTILPCQNAYYSIYIFFNIQGVYKTPIHINVFLQEKFKSEFKERVFCNDLRRLCCPRLSNPEDEELALGAIPISQRTNGM